MEPGFMLKGLAVGFSIAAPVGPIGVLCIRRTLAEGFLPGVTAGLGAATADAVYGTVAAFGLTAVTSFLVGQRIVLGLVGGAFLCVLGCRIFFSRPASVEDRTADGSANVAVTGGRNVADTGGGTVNGILKKSAVIGGGYLSTFFLTVTNPLTILFFVAVFAGAGLGAAPDDYGSAGLLVSGVFSGSALWWLILCAATGFFRKMINEGTMRVINYVAGVVIACFGVYSIYSVL
jgi:threonine/homoserine/homoserine lactone efflux protein